MYEITHNIPFLKSEIGYRSARVRSGLTGSQSHGHPSWVRLVRRVQSSDISC